MLRKYVAAIAVALLLLSAAKPAQAISQPVVPAAPFGAAGYATVGFIGVVAILCGWDLYLKMNGLKNWDGSKKKGVKLPFPY
jgi:hypothetical protein